MIQRHTSVGTSINKTKLPVCFKLVKDWNSVSSVLDYGCGRYPEVAGDWLKKNHAHVTHHYFDPYQKIGSVHTADIGVISNVLNVIDSDDCAADCVRECLHHVNTVYITVYEGDGTGVGRETKQDCWQSNRTTKMWCDFLIARGFNATRKGKLITIKK